MCVICNLMSLWYGCHSKVKLMMLSIVSSLKQFNINTCTSDAHIP